MKRMSFVAASCLLMLCFCLSCSRTNHNSINLTVSESDNYFKIIAHYNENRQYKIDKYMDKRFGRAGNMSFADTRINGNITMDDGTTFFIEKKPGFLDIKFNKNENSTAAYLEVKDFGNDLKSVIQ